MNIPSVAMKQWRSETCALPCVGELLGPLEKAYVIKISCW